METEPTMFEIVAVGAIAISVRVTHTILAATPRTGVQSESVHLLHIDSKSSFLFRRASVSIGENTLIPF